MRKGPRARLSGGEVDAFGRFGRRYLHWKAGSRKWFKNFFWRKQRRALSDEVTEYRRGDYWR